MTPMTPAEREQIRRQVVASRRRQGRPDTVEDTQLLDRLAAELVTAGSDKTLPFGTGLPSGSKTDRA
jgi:hypothetical protein